MKNIVVLILLIIAVSLSGWSIFKNKKPVVAATVDASNKPDAFMENVTAIIMNKNGSPSLIIKAPKMTHYYEQDKTNIEKPEIIVYRQSPEPWRIRSKYAIALKGINEIQFWDRVVIFHKSDSANPTTTILTSALTVFPNDQTAKTSQPIIFKQPFTTVHGVGMVADMNIGTIKVLSHARGDYVPNS